MLGHYREVNPGDSLAIQPILSKFRLERGLV